MPAHQWTADQIKFMEWLSLPGDDLMGKGKGLRQPQTITALAKELGYHRDTLYAWQEIPGWEEALATVAERTVFNTSPDIYRTMLAVLMKPGSVGYDRVFTAFQRYLKPILDDKAFNGDWVRKLPVLDNRADNSRRSYANAVGRMRELPPDQRELFLNILSEAFNSEDDEVIVTRNVNVRKVYTGEEEPETSSKVPALPAPASVEDTPSTLSSNNPTPKLNLATGKWKPKPKHKR